jgi:hypothetical protein
VQASKPVLDSMQDVELHTLGLSDGDLSSQSAARTRTTGFRWVAPPLGVFSTSVTTGLASVLRSAVTEQRMGTAVEPTPTDAMGPALTSPTQGRSGSGQISDVELCSSYHRLDVEQLSYRRAGVELRSQFPPLRLARASGFLSREFREKPRTANAASADGHFCWHTTLPARKL